MDEQTGTRVVEFHKSTHSGAVNGNCVEVGFGFEVLRIANVYVRDTKDPGKTTLTFTVDEWKAFIAGVKDGEFEVDL